MVTRRNSRQHRTTVKLRKKVNSSGTKSLYLDIHLNGKRLPKEYLNIILEGSERSSENKEKLRIAETARLAKENQLVVQKLGLPEHVAKKEVDTYAYILQKSKNLKATGRYEYLINKLKAYCKQPVLPLSSVDKEFCIGFQDYLRANTGQGTAHSLLFTFSSFLNRAFEEELIKENPVRRIPKNERLKKKKSKPEFLTMEEIEQLANYTEGIHPQVRLAFLFSCFTGMRWSDVSRLKYDQITTQVIDGTSVKILYYQQQKTGEITQVPLNIQAEEILQQRKEIAGKEPKSAFAFPKLMPQPELKEKSRYSWANWILKMWGKEAGITKRMHFHLARHSFATMTITYGGDLYTASKLLGHTDIQSTQIYAHVVSKPKLDAMQKISEATLLHRKNKANEKAK